MDRIQCVPGAPALSFDAGQEELEIRVGRLAIDRRPILPDEHDPPVILDWDYYDRRRVPDDGDLVLATVREAALLDLNGKHATSEGDGHL